ncbi:MAG: hypothetical protein AAF449_25105, partial [Myxococcota bacterium]
WENCSQSTGEYTAGLMQRYRVDGDPTLLDRARRSFGTFEYIFERGKEVEEGYMPKLYGDKLSRQTSSDQTLYAMVALEAFHPFASPAEQGKIDHMIVKMVEFWMDRDYKLDYFWWDDMQWPLGRFTSKLLLAIRHGGGEKFEKEYRRLLAIGVNRDATEARLWPKLDPSYEPMAYEKQQNAYYVGEFCGSISMEVTEIDVLLRLDPDNGWADCWRHCIRRVFDEAKLAISPDGFEYLHILVDMDTLDVRVPEPQRLNVQDARVWQGFDYAIGARSTASSYIARAALEGYRHLRDPQMAEVASHVLRSFEPHRTPHYLDPERFAAPYRHRTRLLAGNDVVNWIWAYWLGRELGVFDGK